jgi:hypothetical protein
MNQTPNRRFPFSTVFSYDMSLQVRFKTKGLLHAALVWALSALVVYSVDVFAFDPLAWLFNDAEKVDLLQVAAGMESFLTMTTCER